MQAHLKSSILTALAYLRFAQAGHPLRAKLLLIRRVEQYA